MSHYSVIEVKGEGSSYHTNLMKLKYYIFVCKDESSLMTDIKVRITVSTVHLNCDP